MSDAFETQVMVVLTTAPDVDVARRMGASLVEERLAACANVVDGLTSIYRWTGGIERDSEVLVMLKTTAEGVEALRERVVELHPYEVPEVLAFPVAVGHEPYLSWVRNEVAPRAP